MVEANLVIAIKHLVRNEWLGMRGHTRVLSKSPPTAGCLSFKQLIQVVAFDLKIVSLRILELTYEFGNFRQHNWKYH